MLSNQSINQSNDAESDPIIHLTVNQSINQSTDGIWCSLCGFCREVRAFFPDDYIHALAQWAMNSMQPEIIQRALLDQNK